MLNKKRAFVSGVQNIMPVMPQTEQGEKAKYLSFLPLGDVLPIEPKEQNREYMGLFNKQPVVEVVSVT